MKLTDLPPLILQCLEAGVEIGFGRPHYGTGNVVFKVEGFYKSGHITLSTGSTIEWVAIDRYGKSTGISTFEDLVELNYDWWISSRDRYGDGVLEPNQPWRDLMIKQGLIKANIITVYEPVK